MPGTLTLSTLSDGTNSTNATDVVFGSARAWVNFNGTTSTIQSSYNVSSITKGGTGNYTVNFTNALTSARYAASGMSIDNGSGSGSVVIIGAMSISTLNVYTITPSSIALADSSNVSVAIFR